MKLTHENFLKSRDYIFVHSDDINRVWFRYNFENNDTDTFMSVLAQYQHENGGFGGLIYEWEYSGPTLKDTEHAFRYIFYLKDKPPADHPVIQKMMKYLIDRYRPEIGHWGSMEELGVNDGVHVPWWGYNEDEYPPIEDENERILKYNPNGHAALAAFVALYSELVPEDLYRDIIKYPTEKILRYYDEASPLFKKSSINDCFYDDITVPYNLRCYQHFVSCLKNKLLANRLKTILLQNPTACMNMDKAVWVNDFENVPCDIVSYPESFLYPSVITGVDESLDALINRQNKDGAWHLTWRFGENETFDRLQVEFEAHLTNLYLAILGRFGRIENKCGY